MYGTQSRPVRTVTYTRYSSSVFILYFSLLLSAALLAARAHSTPNRRYGPLVQYLGPARGGTIEVRRPEMKPNLSTISVVISIAFSVPALAEDQLPTEAFLASPSNGAVVMDTYGNCVRTSSWSAEKAVEGCGKMKPAPVATVAPQSTQSSSAASSASAAPAAAAAAPAASSSDSSASSAAAVVPAAALAAAAPSQNKPMRT